MTLALTHTADDEDRVRRLKRMYPPPHLRNLPRTRTEEVGALAEADTDPLAVIALSRVATEMRALAERNPGERVPHTLSNSGQPNRLAWLELRKQNEELCLRIAWSGGIMSNAEINAIRAEFGVPDKARISSTTTGQYLQHIFFVWDELDQLALF